MRIKKSEMPLLVLALNTLAVRGERMDAETLNRFNSMARNVNQELGREAVVTMSQTGGKWEMVQTVKEGDKVVLIGTMLGGIVATEAGEVIALGQGKAVAGLAEVEILKVRLECGDVVSVPAHHVHIPA